MFRAFGVGSPHLRVNAIPGCASFHACSHPYACRQALAWSGMGKIHSCFHGQNSSAWATVRFSRHTIARSPLRLVRLNSVGSIFCI